MLFLIAALLVACLLWYMLVSFVPLTMTAIVVMVLILGWISFVDHQHASDTTINLGVALIILAFVVDVLRKVRGLFRRRAR